MMHVVQGWRDEDMVQDGRMRYEILVRMREHPVKPGDDFHREYHEGMESQDRQPDAQMRVLEEVEQRSADGDAQVHFLRGVMGAMDAPHEPDLMRREVDQPPGQVEADERQRPDVPLVSEREEPGMVVYPHHDPELQHAEERVIGQGAEAVAYQADPAFLLRNPFPPAP
jgi:hypothetical protein